MAIYPFPRPLAAPASLPPETAEGEQEISVRLADAASDAALFDPRALFAAASTLGRRETLSLTFEPGRHYWQLNIGLASPELCETQIEQALHGFLMLIAPQSRFAPARTSAAGRSLARTRFFPAGSQIEIPGRERITLPAPMSAAADLAAAFRIAAAAGIEKVVFRFSAHVPDAEDFRLIDLAPYGAVPESDAGRAALHFLDLWRQRRRGVALDIALAGPNKGHRLLGPLALALFGGPSGAPAAGAGDMRLALPEGCLPAWFRAPRLEDLRILPSAGDSSPPDMPRPGDLVVGCDLAGVPVRLEARDRVQHMFVIGGTGTGKTTLIEHLVVQDMAGPDGVLLIDPHGDLSEGLLGRLSERQRSRLVVIDPGDPACRWRLDLFATAGLDADAEHNRTANQLIGFFQQMF